VSEAVAAPVGIARPLEGFDLERLEEMVSSELRERHPNSRSNRGAEYVRRPVVIREGLAGLATRRGGEYPVDPARRASHHGIDVPLAAGLGPGGHRQQMAHRVSVPYALEEAAHGLVE